MRNFFRSKLFIFAVAVLLVSCTLLILSAVRDGRALPFSAIANAIASPFQKTGASLSSFVQRVGDYLYNFDMLEEENARLRDRVGELEAALRDAEQTVEENDRLRELLSLKEKNRSFTFEMAEVIAVSSASWDSAVTLDKGGNHDVALNDCVVTGQGMVGYISELGPTYSRVTLVTDSAMQCGAIVSRSREVAVAEGSFTFQKQGRLKLSYLPTDADILTGDTVETSGLGGLFPKGILIGSVERVAAEDHGITNYAVLKPAVDFDTMRKVFVITDYEIEE